MEFRILEKTRKENLVTFFKGELPILLTAPHGGNKQPGDIAGARVQEKGYKVRSTETFSRDFDENTYELSWLLADRLQEKLGEAPYVVTAEFHRKYVDVDRNNRLLGVHELPYENHAYDDPAGEKYYQQYHNKIHQYVEDIKHRFEGEGLLFDIHGSVLKNNKIVVGMVTYDPLDFQRNFRRGHVSVDSLIARFGLDPLYHPHSGFLSMLHGKPLPGKIQTEAVPSDRFQKASLTGGFTVITYGSNRPDGINALQLACSQKLRTQWLKHTVELYASAIHSLYRNVIEVPGVINTVFAGKRCMGNKNPGKPTRSTSFEFPLNHSPKKGYPAVIIIHARRVKNGGHRVMLNDHLLGCLKAGHQVSTFEVDNKGWGKLRKKRNQLTISMDQNQPGEEEGFDIVKVDILCCCY